MVVSLHPTADCVHITLPVLAALSLSLSFFLTGNISTAQAEATTTTTPQLFLSRSLVSQQVAS